MTDARAAADKIPYLIAACNSMNHGAEGYLCSSCVADAVAQAVAAERERCAQIADAGGCDAEWNGRDQEERDKIDFTAKRIAEALRAAAERGDG